MAVTNKIEFEPKSNLYQLVFDNECVYFIQGDWFKSMSEIRISLNSEELQKLDPWVNLLKNEIYFKKDYAKTIEIGEEIFYNAYPTEVVENKLQGTFLVSFNYDEFEHRVKTKELKTDKQELL